jgi:hypothetical protein
MSSWSEFALAAPDFAATGRRLLVGSDGVAIAFLATANAEARPHLSPVCPIFCGDDLFLSAGGKTPKVRDLRENGAYTLHAFLAENDEEFQLAGSATEVVDAEARAAVHSAIPFPSFDETDPIFRFDIEGALWVFWERVGQPDTRPVRRRWTVSG